MHVFSRKPQFFGVFIYGILVVVAVVAKGYAWSLEFNEVGIFGSLVNFFVPVVHGESAYE